MKDGLTTGALNWSLNHRSAGLKADLVVAPLFQTFQTGNYQYNDESG